MLRKLSVLSKALTVNEGKFLHPNKLIRSLPSSYSSDPTSDDGSEKLQNILKNKFPNAKDIAVEDISGGCGSMYEVWVASDDFKGLSVVKQHKLVTKALKEEIKDMHGLRITTTLPET